MASYPNFPEHLIDAIAQRVHRTHFQPTLKNLRSRLSPFERLLCDAPTLHHWVAALKETYPTIEIKGDSFHGFHTIVLKLTADYFVAFHCHEDINATEYDLLEGIYQDDSYTITKFYNNASVDVHQISRLLLIVIDLVMNPNATLVSTPIVVRSSIAHCWRKHDQLIDYLDSNEFRPYVKRITI
jgi:hypothetical protein